MTRTDGIPSVSVVARSWRTPLGATIEGAMARLYAGERAAHADPRPGYACTMVAPIREEAASSRQDRYLRRMGLFGLEVATEALRASGLAGGPRVGLFSGVGGLRAHWDDMLGAFAGQHDDGERMWERGLKAVHPYWMLRHLSNNVHALASAALDLRGEGATFGGASGGAQALAAAARALHAGAIDAALVVAYDSLLEPETLVELGARRSATLAGEVIAPYAAAAAGFVPGEAAAAVVLVRDGAPGSLARISARASAGPFALEACAGVLARGSARVGFVDGAAQAWPELDRAERELGAAALEDPRAPLTAITAAMGQLGAATALVQAIALAEMLRAGAVAPVAGLSADAVAVGPLVPVTARTPTTARAALGLYVGAPELASAVRVEVPA